MSPTAILKDELERTESTSKEKTQIDHKIIAPSEIKLKAHVMLATKSDCIDIEKHNSKCHTMLCKESPCPLEEMHVSLPPVATSLLQESDDLEKKIESRMTQIQERGDDEDIDPKDTTTTSTRCTASSTSPQSSSIGLAATTMSYYPIGPRYFYSYELSYVYMLWRCVYMSWCCVYMPWCYVTNYWPTGYVIYGLTWPTWPM